MTQTQRVLKASRSFQGVCQADFSGETVDEGPIITRVAARLWDLESQGYCFEHIGWRNKTKCWRLVSEPELTGAPDERRPDALVASGPAAAGTIGQASDVPVSLKPLFERVKGTLGFGEEEAA